MPSHQTADSVQMWIGCCGSTHTVYVDGRMVMLHIGSDRSEQTPKTKKKSKTKNMKYVSARLSKR